MLKNEFIEIQRQDLVTSSNNNVKQMLEAFEEVLKDYPLTQEIDNSKTCEECYKKMEEEAHKKSINGSYCFGPSETKEFIINYLGLENKDNTTIINLEDFI